MPLELVREVDRPVEDMILATRESARHVVVPEEVETLYQLAFTRIRRLSSSPILLALHFRFVQLASKHPATSWTFWTSLFLNITILPLAIGQIPFVQESLSILHIIQLAGFNNIFPSTVGATLHTVIGFLLGSAYEATLITLHGTEDSIWEIVATAIEAFMISQVVLTVLLVGYIHYAFPWLFGRSNTPRFVYIFTLTSQRTLSQLNGLARRLSSPFSRRTEQERPKTHNFLGPLGEDYLLGPYTTLPGGSIRLLRVHKREPSDDGINCQFIIVPLISAPPYEAISYVWGSSVKENTITVDNRKLSITKSAFEILHRGQSLWQERVIWIDQICINQEDTEEKAKQVQMMRDIYTRASRVTAWLGSSPTAELVQRFFAELDVLNGSVHGSPEKLKQRLSVMFEQKLPHLYAAAEFLKNPWFRRVWIIQEAACAKKIYLIYGDVCMDWMYLCRTIAVLLSRDLLTIFPRTDANGNPLSIEDNMNRRLGLHNADSMMAFRGDINYNKPLTLSWLLGQASKFDSTDPRDMVYALLGLARDNSRIVITPNYDKTNTPASVYTQATRLLFSQETPEPPAALYRSGIGFARSGKVQDLPSWVPDFSHTTQCQFVHDRYAAGTRYTFNMRPVLSGPNSHKDHCSIICLHGEIFDQVEHLGSVCPSKDGDTHLDEILQVQRLYDEAYALALAHVFKKKSKL